MRILLIFFLIINLYASSLKNKDILSLFKDKYYHYICIHRWEYINKYLGKREDLLSIVAYACLKNHSLTYALDLAKALRFTKEGRANSTYIVSLFAIKNYIVRYIEDGFDLNSIEIPSITSDDLGKIFNLIKKEKPIVKNGSFFVNLDEFNVKVGYNVKKNYIILEFYKDNKLIKKEVYW